MKLRPSSFGGVPDLPRVKQFLLGRKLSPNLPDYWTAGKSTVGTFQAICDSPPEHHRFWEDRQGNYHAYLWLHPEPSETIAGNGNAWRVLAHPEARTAALVSAMIVSAEESLVKMQSAESPPETVAYGKDAWLASILAQHGYVRREALEVYMRRKLERPISEPGSPPGYIIRPLDADKDLIQRAGAQSDAFAGQRDPGEWAIENARRFLRWYEGRSDLDLVAVTTAGEIAAFAVFVVDPGTRLGELDPVGTRPAYRRKGLAKSVLLTGLAYLKASGMEHAVVRTGTENTAAIRTYEAVGFDVVDHLYRYTKVTT